MLRLSRAALVGETKIRVNVGDNIPAYGILRRMSDCHEKHRPNANKKVAFSTSKETLDAQH